MERFEHLDNEIIGRVGYVDASKQWGYLHGPRGERVYFHVTGVHGSIAALAPGAEVCYRVGDGGDQLCAVEVASRAGRR